MNFVIQFHECDNDHFDMMLEYGAKLYTWHIIVPDMDRLMRGEQIGIERIQDHDTKYLSYEGLISCDRGHVRIYDSGEYIILSWTDLVHKIELHGTILQGLFIIELKPNGLYRLYKQKENGNTI